MHAHSRALEVSISARAGQHAILHAAAESEYGAVPLTAAGVYAGLCCVCVGVYIYVYIYMYVRIDHTHKTLVDCCVHQM